MSFSLASDGKGSKREFSTHVLKCTLIELWSKLNLDGSRPEPKNKNVYYLFYVMKDFIKINYI